MHIVLIGNYRPDQQESMERFTLLLEQEFKCLGHHVEVWRPKAFFGAKAKCTTQGTGKWLGYIDKWLLFPLILRAQSLWAKDVHYHICDHSNSPYLAHLPQERASITCHDVLAIRGALGYADAHCPASRFGKILQFWILKRLLSAKKLACVSQLTMSQLQELANENESQNSRTVIYNSFNAEFSPLPRKEALSLLNEIGVDTTIPYILHVGSSLPRKNRGFLLKMVAELGERWSGHICYAGQPLDADLINEAKSLGLSQRVISVANPNHSTLVALYSICDAFIFPSYSEGFGWPVIEAQACGAPVLASDIPPMPEISGGAAIHAQPNDVAEFSNGFLYLKNPSIRRKIVEKGFENIKRFKPKIMAESYVSLFRT